MSDFGVNSYLLISDEMNGVLIDAPYDDGYILRCINENGVKLQKLLLTHGHCDHIASAAYITANTGCEVYIHEADMPKLTNDSLNLTRFFHLPPIDPIKNVHALHDGDTVTQDEIIFKVLHTPGHTSGCVCYITGEEIYCGDTLMRGSVGRVDMPDGNAAIMRRTLKMLKIFEPQTDYTLFPGHGASTSISRERRLNPYLISEII